MTDSTGKSEFHFPSTLDLNVAECCSNIERSTSMLLNVSQTLSVSGASYEALRTVLRLRPLTCSILMSITDYSKGFGGKYGVQTDRQDAVSGITSDHKFLNFSLRRALKGSSERNLYNVLFHLPFSRSKESRNI